MNITASEIIKTHIKKPSISKGLAVLLGSMDCHCYLLSKGVRKLAVLSPYWTTSKHTQHFQVFKNIAKSNGVAIIPKKITNPQGIKSCWEYFLFKPGHRGVAERFIRLYYKPLKRPSDHMLIGKMLGYSHEEILKIYGKKLR